MTNGPRGTPPLVAHIIHRLDVGGMENGLVNLINHMPADRYRHAIVCMTDYTDFSRRIRRDDVTLHALHKQEGKDLKVHGRLWRLLRRLRPDIVHTRNMATLETQAIAALAGVRRRVHGEHGWDIGDLDGSRAKTRHLRRVFRPLVGQYIALSRHQLDYLSRQISVAPARLNHICNGVDVVRFSPRDKAQVRSILPEGFAPPEAVVIGAVMRMQAVKAPDILVEAVLALLRRDEGLKRRLRLVMIGDGPLWEGLQARLREAGVADLAWLPGNRDDIPDLMAAMDLCVVPSLAEGICNTVLEAMATGLPVIGTAVGGNPDLIEPGRTGTLIPAGDPEALADALSGYLDDMALARTHGGTARERAQQRYSLEAMVQGYLNVYDRLSKR
ncbi:TIGR03088 family PEP-CTERM/XrtA system glycosyltransferase [Ectothiorhodospira shaposhnikovii]|uniref:TIGR03088 family PEP-CTERM/XrtA system glycosyltransferase n=1 Tax=Ectothiorhodospira shaposhnikovii TaxID=1054 RepID=UPI00399F0073